MEVLDSGLYQRFDRMGVEEGGFTLVELIIVFSIISILASLAFTAFSIYKTNAYYANAESSFHSARVAFEQGDMDAADGYALGITFSGIEGEPLAGDMAAILPGAVPTTGVKLGVMYNSCPNNAMVLTQFLSSTPCDGDRLLSWSRFCDGTEVMLQNVANPGGC